MFEWTIEWGQTKKEPRVHNAVPIHSVFGACVKKEKKSDLPKKKRGQILERRCNKKSQKTKHLIFMCYNCWCFFDAKLCNKNTFSPSFWGVNQAWGFKQPCTCVKFYYSVTSCLHNLQTLSQVKFRWIWQGFFGSVNNFWFIWKTKA